jgi:hypothetical protein
VDSPGAVPWKLCVKVESNRVAEIDAFAEPPVENFLSSIWNGELAAVRVNNLASSTACHHLTQRLLASEAAVDHLDVAGLRVIGLSHFQVARDTTLIRRYQEEARTTAGMLRHLASPYASPFDSALAFITQWWPPGCQLMTLDTEGRLSPFTVRIYREGVGIEPHQDILSAESPNDPSAKSLIHQFGANIYLSMGVNTYKDLAEGPRVVSRDSLPAPVVTIAPVVGELIIFPSHSIHAVKASEGSGSRITISFFIGVQSNSSALKVWI